MALIGHAGVALAFVPLWTTYPSVSTGNPSPAVFAELVPSSSLESMLASSTDNHAAIDHSSDVESATEANDALPAETTYSLDEPALDRTKPVKAAEASPGTSRSSKPNPNKKRAEKNQRLFADALASAQGNPTAQDPAQQTFGHSAVVTDIPSTWKSRLLAHLDRFKLYPEVAKSRHEEGVTLLCFTLDRDGRVLGFFVSRSSGSNVLDDAAQKMVERASPVPPIPDDVPGQTLQLVVPVRFSVKQ